ncbi:MAG: heme NO-binding domain-containing protein [Gaiellaceae bacterium]
MHGLIFTGLRDYSLQRLGEQEAERVWGGRRYEPTEAYDDDEFRARLDDLREATGDDPGDLERGFGIFAAETTFADLYPDYYARNDETLGFLLGIEQTIHTLVRATIRGARPPNLHVRRFGKDGVLVSYTSERRLCALLEGLVRGVSSHYGGTVRIEQIQCMHRGDTGCVFTVERLREAT